VPVEALSLLLETVRSSLEAVIMLIEYRGRESHIRGTEIVLEAE
jgi:hypothetical protein